MTLPADVERFLKEVRRGLGSMDAAERDDVIEELRSHFIERQTQGKANLLDGFEDPQTMAASFVGERALRGALSQGTPWAFLRALVISARNSLLAFFVLIPLVLAQVIAFFCVLTAALKPFAPAEFGLWVGHGNFYVGRGTPSGHEVLGWWGVPILLVIGVVLFWVSNRALRAVARRRLQSHRSERP
jgi:Protein of unknown function (DUF1700)